MKLFFLILQLSVISYISAQSIEINDDFEGNGTINNWTQDNCLINTAFSNPYKQNINTSQTVMKYHDQGGQYANVRFDIEENYELSMAHSFSLKIYVESSSITGNEPNQISLKLQNNKLAQPWSTQVEIIKSIELDKWQLVEFDFSNDAFINLDPTALPPYQRTDLNRVVIQINGENNYSHVIAYIDDFIFAHENSNEPVYNNLIWSDEFENEGNIDQNWFFQTQLPANGSWYNNEIQHYTNRSANAYKSDGSLKIIAKKETYTDQGQTKYYTSARLNSKFSFQYGRIEIRAKLPQGHGTWPAIWMLGKNINENGAYFDNLGFGNTPWPYCGEIDIMEHWGDNPNYIQSATHTPSSHGNTINHGGQYISNVFDEFHLYALTWTPEKLIFSVDNQIHYTYNPSEKDSDNWPFDSEQYIVLNIAILPHIDPNFEEGIMEIDFIRIYQEATTASKTNPSSSVHFYPNPVDAELRLYFNTIQSGTAQLKIYTIDGKLVKQITTNLSGKQINLTDLNYLKSGFYILQIEKEKETHSVKFLKQ